MNEAECSFLHLKTIHISISMNSLLASFVHFSTQLLDLSLLIYRSSLYTVRKLVLCLKLELKRLPHFISCLFTLLMVFLPSVKFYFFTTSNLTHLVHGFWVLSQISKSFPFSQLLEISYLITHVLPMFE